MAAQLLADDRLSNEEIAEKCGINRKSLTRWMKQEYFVSAVAEFKKKAAEGAAKATEKKAFNTTDRLIELANIQPADTNGTITGQVRACMGIAAIRGEIVERHADVTDRLRDKTADELDFIAMYRRDPVDAAELQAFMDSRKRQPQ